LWQNNHLGGGFRVGEHPFVHRFRENWNVVVATVFPALVAQLEVIVILARSLAGVGVRDVDFAFDLELIV
jgi:hypothetical protein